MSLDAAQLLTDLKRRVRTLEDDLRAQATAVPEVDAHLRSEYKAGREAGRIGDAFESWREGMFTQAAVHWVLGGVFVRFLEDNELTDPYLGGPGERGREAADRYAHYFQQPGRGTDNDRDYLLYAFQHVAGLPDGDRLFDSKHNPVWHYPISADAARDLLAFWREIDPDTGTLRHDFADPEWDSRFLGDLYQDLSDWAKKTYALLQTPDFVESFILDRTLEPALREFGLEEVRLIDPTCGSGHFLLSAFRRLLDRWQRREPGTPERALVQRALDAVYGVDINPFAVAIARFRLLVAALKASGVQRLSQAPDFKLHVATGDSLLFGARKGQLSFPVGFQTEDVEEAHRILTRQYHAVVGNPPYITPKDRALRDRYRVMYDSCYRQYALSVPFMERFWELAVRGENGQSAGYIGKITANSFMKREFGKKVIEEFFPTVDLTHIVDTSGAYIPGHGTPTVILLGRNRSPVGETVRTVMGIRGEPSTPLEPSLGQVWVAILHQMDLPDSESEFVSVADSSRSAFGGHPWSLRGGGASKLKQAIESSRDALASVIDLPVGRAVRIAEEEVFTFSEPRRRHAGIPAQEFRVLLKGEEVRDWAANVRDWAWYPYCGDATTSLMPKNLWPWRHLLATRSTFQGIMEDAGLEWYEYMQFTASAYETPLSITFSFVATHNHFVLDRGGKVFKQSAPIIKLPAQASEADHIALLGLLNSSTACFWLKENAHNMGDSTDSSGARVTGDPAFDTYQFNGTQVSQLPIPVEKPLSFSTRLDALAQERQQRLPTALADALPMPRDEWEDNRTEADRLRREMIALQDELDWRCYRLYGITEDELTYQDADGQPRTPPEIDLGERAFEIGMARRMAAGELKTTWFERHGSTPLTEIPSHWPEAYRHLVERRIERIEADRYVGLVERPEYKRRWNTEPWDGQAQRALEAWLKSRLEAAAYWPEAALQTTHQLADRAQRDADFMAVAALYRGQVGFNVHTLVKALVEGEAVPFLPVLRYKPSGLRKRKVWERTWAQQRHEDAVDAAVEAELTRREGETDEQFQDRLARAQKKRKAAEVGDIPRPPKYSKSDFVSGPTWSLRGKLDVPKERFISYPFCSKESDPSLLVGWAGWDHLAQAQALAAWLNEMVEREGWPPERLTPLLAGLAELIPWLKQWHNDLDPTYGQRLGDFFAGYLDGQLHQHGLTREDLSAWTPPKKKRGRRRKSST